MSWSIFNAPGMLVLCFSSLIFQRVVMREAGEVYPSLSSLHLSHSWFMSFYISQWQGSHCYSTAVICVSLQFLLACRSANPLPRKKKEIKKPSSGSENLGKDCQVNQHPHCSDERYRPAEHENFTFTSRWEEIICLLAKSLWLHCGKPAECGFSYFVEFRLKLN